MEEACVSVLITGLSYGNKWLDLSQTDVYNLNFDNRAVAAKA